MCICVQCGRRITGEHSEVQINGQKHCFCPWKRPEVLKDEPQGCCAFFMRANRERIWQYRSISAGF